MTVKHLQNIQSNKLNGKEHYFGLQLSLTPVLLAVVSLIYVFLWVKGLAV